VKPRKFDPSKNLGEYLHKRKKDSKPKAAEKPKKPYSPAQGGVRG
jgi:hypothetical protein